MVDSEKSPDNYKTLKISTGAKIMYVPDQYETQEMCDKVIPGNGGTLRFLADCYNNQKMCCKAVDNYSQVLEFFRSL